MTDPIYNLSLTPNAAGDFVAKSAPIGGWSSFYPIPLGATYSDAFRMRRADARES